MLFAFVCSLVMNTFCVAENSRPPKIEGAEAYHTCIAFLTAAAAAENYHSRLLCV